MEIYVIFFKIPAMERFPIAEMTSKGHSRSLAMTQFDRSHMKSHYHSHIYCFQYIAR